MTSNIVLPSLQLLCTETLRPNYVRPLLPALRVERKRPVCSQIERPKIIWVCFLSTKKTDEPEKEERANIGPFGRTETVRRATPLFQGLIKSIAVSKRRNSVHVFKCFVSMFIRKKFDSA